MTAATAGTAAIASIERVTRNLGPDDSRYSRFSSCSKHGKGSLESGQYFVVSFCILTKSISLNFNELHYPIVKSDFVISIME